jgi:hypothetical protein
MIGDQGLQLTADDDAFHVPTTDDPLWSETTWFSFMVPERKLYVYVYPWVRPNQHIFGGGVMAWDDKGHNPWDCAVWDYEWNKPMPELGDLRSFTSPTGIGVECLEPLTRYRITYDRPGCSIDVEYEALMEPHVIGRGEPAGLFTAHFDQPGHVTGHMVLDGDKMDVDCYSIRDRSWGPRTENRDFRLGYTCAQTANSAFLAITYPDLPGDQAQWGYYWRDGEAAALVSGTRTIERDPSSPWPTSVVIEATDALGREVHAVGECMNRISYTNVPYMFVWVSLVRWEFDGGIAWGEDQDAWHVEKYRAFARSRSATLATR